MLFFEIIEHHPRYAAKRDLGFVKELLVNQHAAPNRFSVTFTALCLSFSIKRHCPHRVEAFDLFAIVGFFTEGDNVT